MHDPDKNRCWGDKIFRIFGVSQKSFELLISMKKYKEKFADKYDWMFRRQIANLPITPESVRKDFKTWWDKLGSLVDEKQKQKILNDFIYEDDIGYMVRFRLNEKKKV